ncbi:MAG: hypothetical protein QOF01_4072 [Thermomicrobiales bacterium]|nr:hypothetical protein [Thermomicrobiales bacterium]
MESGALLNKLQWRLIGPFRGGRSVAGAGDPNDPAVFYIGTTGGGIWKTEDGGQYWRNVSDGFFKRASVGALAVSHSDPNVIYVGMGETTIRGNVSHGDGVYKSTDGGRSWSHLGLAATRNIGKVRIDPRDPDRVYVAAFGHAHGPNPERGLYRSKDGGETWELVLSRGDKAGANDLSLDPKNPRIIYASFWEAHRGPYSLTSGGEGSGLFRSTDGGTTWTDLTDKPGMPKGLKGKIGVAVSPAKTGRVWAIVENENGGVFRSDDGGETWEKLNDDRRLRQRAWYYSHIYADPLDAETVWVLNVEMFRSVDGGKTFNSVPAPHGDNHDLWIDPANPRRMILANDGGGTVTYNGGIGWSSQYSQPTSEMYHVTVDSRLPYRVYGSQQDNTSITVPSRSNHGVITRTEWHEIGGGEAGYIATHPDNPNIVFAGEYQGYMTRYDHSTGQARNVSVWPEEYSGSGAEAYKYRFQWTYPIIISPHDPNTVYCGGNHVFRSNDEGSSWEAASPDLTFNDPETLGSSGGPITKDNTGAEVYGTVFTLAESPKQQGVLWAGTDDGKLHVSQDTGKTWTEVTPADLPDWTLMSIIEASPHDPAVAYLAANRYKHDDFHPYLYKTADYGKTWTKITGGIPEDDFARVIREDPERRGLLFAGTETGIYVSYDDGVNWQRLGGNFPVVPVHDLLIHKNDLVIGTHGRSFWIFDDMTLFRQLAGTAPAPDATHLFTPRETIRYGSMFTFGHAPVTGLNYAFAATQVPAYDYKKMPDGEIKVKWLDAGENPPDGVIVHYTLPDDAPGDVSLTFLDDAGNELRTVKSKKPEDDEKKEDEFPPKAEGQEEKDEDPYVPAKKGLNRFVWDMRLTPATKIATKGGDQPGRTGPKVVPGCYQVRLEANGQSQTASFRIVKDPRQSTTDEEFRAQFDLINRINQKHDEMNKAVNQIRAARTQAIEWARRVKETDAEEKVTTAAKALSEQLDAIEGELLQMKIKSDQDNLNYPAKLNAKLAALAGMVGNADAAPTKQAGELYESLARQVDEQLAKLATVLDKGVAEFNAVVSGAGVPAVGATTTK